ncbi:hypothetical protein F4819DRAFT_483596 [Hypoxylon fuscum]|nr:hypothetical protein F4819DRAFT_483596 [Hypoxylon fuscum]
MEDGYPTDDCTGNAELSRTRDVEPPMVHWYKMQDETFSVTERTIRWNMCQNQG